MEETFEIQLNSYYLHCPGLSSSRNCMRKFSCAQLWKFQMFEDVDRAVVLQNKEEKDH